MLINKKFKLILLVISLCLTMSLLGVTITFAWFAHNSQAEQNNILLKAKALPNLIISKDPATITTVTAATADYELDEEFNIGNEVLPATHYTNGGTNLVYLVNTGDVGRNTGIVASPQYGEVTTGENGNNGFFYRDVVVYIASAKTAFSKTTLTATIKGYDTDGNVVTADYKYESFLAASIDFYVQSVSISKDKVTTYGTDTFKGTLNIANKDPVKNDGSSSRTKLTLLSKGTIPLNNSSSTHGYLKITMRFYFDGALLSEPGYAYVKSSTVSTNFEKIEVTFTATESSPT